MNGESTTLTRGGTLVPGIETIGTGPDATREVVDKTPMGSQHARKRPSATSDSGNIEVSCFWDSTDATHQAIAATRDTPVTSEWILTYGDGATHTFDGFETNVKIEGLEKEGEAMLVFTIEIDGDIDEVAGT